MGREIIGPQNYLTPGDSGACASERPLRICSLPVLRAVAKPGILPERNFVQRIAINLGTDQWQHLAARLTP